MAERKGRVDSTGAVAVGLLMMSLGLLMTADRLGLVDIRAYHYQKFWPLALVFLGLGQWLNRQGWCDGLGLAGAGALLLAHNLDVLSLWDSWPLFLVAAGASLVFESLMESRRPAPTSPATSEARHDR
jgi:hypothetical protein